VSLRPRHLGLLTLLALGAAVAPATSRAEVLYLQVEVRQEGRLVANPHLLGETGKPLRAVRRAPGATEADYRLNLVPTATGDRYALAVDLTVGHSQGASDLSLGHGQRRKVKLAGSNRGLEVSVLLMRVDSPEFRAYMEHSPTQPPPASARAI
jgi:hypothetical protein